MVRLLARTRHSYMQQEPTPAQTELFDYLLTLKPVVDRLDAEQLSDAVYSHGALYFIKRLLAFTEQIPVTKKVGVFASLLVLFVSLLLFFCALLNRCS